MCGCVPKQQRFVKPYTYLVQPGDDERVITERFGVCPCRAHELVGANLDKPLADVGPGQVYKRFAGLMAGQKLRIPATWKNPSRYTVDGRVGDPAEWFNSATLQTAPDPSATPVPADAGSLDGLTNFINQIQKGAPQLAAVLQAHPAFTGFPPGSGMQDVYATVYSWYPYLTNTFGVPGNTTIGFPYDPTNNTPPDQQLTNLIQLMLSAIKFLKATGIARGEDPRIQSIPWDKIQWAAIWWNQIVQVASNQGLNTNALWQQIQDLANSVMSPYSTPPVQHKAIYGGKAPNFLTTDWNALVEKTPIGDVDWEDDLVDFLADPEVQSCLTKNPGRYVQMSGCPEVFATGGLENFKKVLCATEPKNPCDAVKPAEPPPPPDEPPPDEPGDVEPVVEVEKKSDNTAMYMGAAAVGLLVGGIALWAAGGKD